VWIAENVPFSVDFRDYSGYNLIGSLVIDHLRDEAPGRTYDVKRDAIRACLSAGSCFFGAKITVRILANLIAQNALT
jgi:hypothetical protein